jgi:hypothetical protein
MSSNYATAIAFTFFATWLATLYAGADHPPPIGFLWLVPLLVACAVAVYLRVPVYVSWSGSHGRGRILRVLVEGVSAGFVVGLVVLLFPITEEPTSANMRLEDVVIWLVVLASVGAANAVLLYALSSVLPRRRR